jgi:DNA-binding NarL/FixJ family response regulator
MDCVLPSAFKANKTAGSVTNPRVADATVKPPFAKTSTPGPQYPPHSSAYEYGDHSTGSATTPVPAPRRPRVLLADDHTLVAEACKNLLEAEFDVVGIVADGRALLRANAVLKPDVIVSDIAMQSLNGLDAGEQIKLGNPEVKLVYLTMIPDQELAAEAFRRGASAYLLKTSAIPELITAVKEALSDRVYISPQVTKDALSEFLRSHKRDYGSKSLTPRQREVLQLLAEGRSMKEAASVLNLTTRTVAFHKYRIMASLGLTTNSQLIQYAIRHFIIPG